MSLKRNISLLKYIHFLSDFRLYFTPALIYFIERFGSNTSGMAIFSVVMISGALLEIPTGVLSDKIGRKKVLQFGLVSSIINLLLFSVGFYLSNYYLMLLGAVFNGLAMSLNSGNNDALLFESVQQIGQEKKFKSISGKVKSLMFYGMSVSAVLGTLLSDFISFQFVLWISILPFVAGLIASHFITEPKQHILEDEKKFLSQIMLSFKTIWKNRKLRFLTLGNTFKFSFGNVGFQYFTVFYNTIFPMWFIGVIRSLENLFSGIGNNLASKVSNYVSDYTIFFTSLISSALITVFAVILNNYWAALLLLIPAVLYGIRLITEINLFQKEFSKKQRATMGSSVSFIGSLAFGVLNVLFGLLADYIRSRLLTRLDTKDSI